MGQHFLNNGTAPDRQQASKKHLMRGNKRTIYFCATFKGEISWRQFRAEHYFHLGLRTKSHIGIYDRFLNFCATRQIDSKIHYLVGKYVQAWERSLINKTASAATEFP